MAESEAVEQRLRQVRRLVGDDPPGHVSLFELLQYGVEAIEKSGFFVQPVGVTPYILINQCVIFFRLPPGEADSHEPHRAV